ncbi:MAG: single-stranded DNA-binding protein [Candidatus Thermoplasmatota archaeon]|jgi:replication factor A1|nr:single-stranded DNA-binding protein [Candidatus Thermoplasmatota archaeon]MCL5790721.1 single-stranded DNA-binding protein [Candidatus Thermoplasmatota archaeon]
MEGITKIKELTPESRRVNVLAKVVEIGEPKEINTRFGETKSVTEVVIGDETGKIRLSLWGEQASNVKDGSTLHIDNGYISLVRGQMRLNVGKYGNLNESEETVSEVNNELDMSEKVYENTNFRRGGSNFRRGGSPGGYGGRSRRDSGSRGNYGNDEEQD